MISVASWTDMENGCHVSNKIIDFYQLRQKGSTYLRTQCAAVSRNLLFIKVAPQ